MLISSFYTSHLQDLIQRQVNTTALGRDLLRSKTPSPTSSARPSPTSIGSFLTGTLKNITDDIKDEVNELVGDAVGKLAKEIGIKQFYSLHLMDMCEGNYGNGTVTKGEVLADLEKNVTDCTNATAMCKYSCSDSKMSEKYQNRESRTNSP